MGRSPAVLTLSSSVAWISPGRQTVIMEIQAAIPSDIPTIMRVERMEGYARLVGRWDAERHAIEIENSSCRYLLAEMKQRSPASLSCKASEAPTNAFG